MKEILGFLKFWIPVVAGGFAAGLGLAWAEKHFEWEPGRGRHILIGFMALAGIAAAWAFYAMIKAEVEDDPWKD